MEEGRRCRRRRRSLTQPGSLEQQLKKGEKSSEGQEASREVHCSLDCRDDNLEKGGAVLRMLPGILFPEPSELAVSGCSLSSPREPINKVEN